MIPLARAKGLAVSVMEWSLRWESPPKSTNDYVAPLGDVAISEFAELLRANSDIVAFTGAHHDSLIVESFWRGDAELGPIWRRTVQVHKANFGKVP